MVDSDFLCSECSQISLGSKLLQPHVKHQYLLKCKVSVKNGYFTLVTDGQEVRAGISVT